MRQWCGLLLVIMAGGAVAGDGSRTSGRAPRREVVAEAATELRVVVGSCQDQGAAQDHWDRMLAERPDLVVLAGDNVYADVVLDEAGRFAGFEQSLARVEAAYASMVNVEAFQRFRAAVPVLATWDDHDYGFNDAGAELPFRAESQALFLDFWGAGPEDARRSREGVYSAAWARAGKLRVQIVLLDVRSFRSPLRRAGEGVPTPDGPYVEDRSPEKTMLGEAQWAWLEARLRERADLRLIVSGTQVLAEGHGHERWGNLPLERERLIRLIEATRAQGVVFVSGDRHFGEILRDDTEVPYPLWELSSSSLNKSFGGRPNEPAPLRVGPQVASTNHGLVRVDPGRREVELTIRAHDGSAGSSVIVALDTLRPR